MPFYANLVQIFKYWKRGKIQLIIYRQMKMSV